MTTTTEQATAEVVADWMPVTEWMDVGAKVLPPEYRERFLAMLFGVHHGSQSNVHRPGEVMEWRAPSGSMPFSPGHALQTLITEFSIRPVTAVSYNLGWECHDSTYKPGSYGDFTITHTVLGVRTRKQVIVFLDGGVAYTPVAIINLPEPATLIGDTP